MKMAAMQPYFFPYIGYYQLMEAADIFMIADDYNYIKESWSNRNSILIKGKPSYINLPLENASVNRKYNEIIVCNNSIKINKLLKTLQYNYAKAKEFSRVYPVISEILLYDESNFALYILNSFKVLCSYLDINIAFILSSSISIEKDLDKSDRIISLSNGFGASTLINPIGGQSLYSKDYFKKKGIDLIFLRPKQIKYSQYAHEFTPWLSIIDVLMFNSKSETKTLLSQYELI